MPKKLVLYDDHGTVLAEIDVGQVKALVKDEAALPKNLEWYKESLTWFITLAIGAAVLGLGFFDKGTSSPLQRNGFAIGGAILGLAVIFGLWAHLKLLLYANHRELGETKEKLKPIIEMFNRWYGASLLFFFLGLFAFGFVAMVKVLTTTGEDVGYTVKTAVVGNTGGAIIVDNSTHASWFVQADAAGIVHAAQLATPTPTPVEVVRTRPAWVRWGSIAHRLHLMPADQRQKFGLRPLPKDADVVRFDGAAIRACSSPTVCKTIALSPSGTNYVWTDEEDVVTAPHATANVRERVRHARADTGTVEERYLDEHGQVTPPAGAANLHLFDTP